MAEGREDGTWQKIGKVTEEQEEARRTRRWPKKAASPAGGKNTPKKRGGRRPQAPAGGLKHLATVSLLHKGSTAERRAYLQNIGTPQSPSSDDLVQDVRAQVATAAPADPAQGGTANLSPRRDTHRARGDLSNAYVDVERRRAMAQAEEQQTAFKYVIARIALLGEEGEPTPTFVVWCVEHNFYPATGAFRANPGPWEERILLLKEYGLWADRTDGEIIELYKKHRRGANALWRACWLRMLSSPRMVEKLLGQSLPEGSQEVVPRGQPRRPAIGATPSLPSNVDDFSTRHPDAGAITEEDIDQLLHRWLRGSVHS